MSECECGLSVHANVGECKCMRISVNVSVSTCMCQCECECGCDCECNKRENVSAHECECVHSQGLGMGMANYTHYLISQNLKVLEIVITTLGSVCMSIVRATEHHQQTSQQAQHCETPLWLLAPPISPSHPQH